MIALNRFARRHHCGYCKGKSRLEVKWDGQLQRERVWCPVCKRTDGFEPAEKGLYRQWQDDPQSVNIVAANRFADRHREEIEEVAAGLPEELGQAVREKFFGLPIPVREEK